MTELKKILFFKGVRQLELARATGIDQGKISRIVCGWDKPTPKQKRLIAWVLRLSVRTVFPGQQEEDEETKSGRCKGFRGQCRPRRASEGVHDGDNELSTIGPGSVGARAQERADPDR